MSESKEFALSAGDGHDIMALIVEAFARPQEHNPKRRDFTFHRQGHSFGIAIHQKDQGDQLLTGTPQEIESLRYFARVVVEYIGLKRGFRAWIQLRHNCHFVQGGCREDCTPEFICVRMSGID